jgi:beta-galactosidase
VRHVTCLNDGWTFHHGHPARGDGVAVTLPHNAVDLPFSYFDERAFQRAFTYRRTLVPTPDWNGREVALVFDGAMADAEVYLDGTRIAAHRDGYTPFEVRLTGRVQPQGSLLEVKVDGSENPSIPPFGGTIDYLTYAGLYRDVWLKLTAPVSLARVRIDTPDPLAEAKSVRAAATLANPQALPLSGTLAATLSDAAGRTVATASATVSADRVDVAFDGLTGLGLWDIDSPVLYRLTLALETPHGTDRLETAFGFREARFTPEGFRLNGRPLKLRGLNRHQSFPYVGYALPRAAQERDAEIVRHELGCNIVRTSHYPQSPWFLDHCDRIGLLVLEEIPGWQHIGGPEWKAQAVENVRAMVQRDWNHPSIVMWGVRINESQDDHDFYAETNRVARALDPTRQTGGIRYITDSEMLEDVYTMNDFILGNEELGGNRPRTALRPQQEVTGLGRDVPYLVTEYNGHMFPTKTWDQEQRQSEHVRRHLDVLNAAAGDPSVSGSIGWCAFDYNTHKDFGSGDRICHHGVSDMFREPKFAAHAYSSQRDPDDRVVLEPVTFWARGDRNIGGVFPLIVLTNCDEVEFSYGDHPSKRVGPDREAFPHLPHPPVVIDRRHFTEDELGRWGMTWEDGVVTGFLGGKPVAEVRMVADPLPTTLQVAPDRLTLAPVGDCVRVIVRALDQVGRKLPFLFDPVQITVTGAARLVGPSVVPFRAGSTGFWIVSTGAEGPVGLSVTSERFGTVETTLTSTPD